MIRTELPGQKLNTVNWLNAPEVHRMLLVVPHRPIVVNLPCTLAGQGWLLFPLTHLLSLVVPQPHPAVSSPVPWVRPTPGPCLPREGWLRAEHGSRQVCDRFPMDFKGSIFGLPRALPLNCRRQGWKKDLLGHILSYLPAKEGLFCTGICLRSLHLALLQPLPAWGSLIRPMRLCRAFHRCNQQTSSG